MPRKEKNKNMATYPLALLSFCGLSFDTTCPQFIIIGGFRSVDRSFDTGHANTEWYRLSRGRKFRSGSLSVSKANLKSDGMTHRQLVRLAPFALPLPHHHLPFLYLRQHTTPTNIEHHSQRRPFAYPQLALNSVANMFSRSRWIVSDVRSSYGTLASVP